MVDRNRHEAGNGGYGYRKPTGYRASSTRREPRFRQPQHPDKPDNIPVCSGLKFRDSSVLDGNCDQSEAIPNYRSVFAGATPSIGAEGEVLKFSS